MPFAVIVNFDGKDDAEEFACLLADLLEDTGGDPDAVMVAEQISSEPVNETLQ
jgi:hypothetical protein